jgi:hypothetical protein
LTDLATLIETLQAGIYDAATELTINGSGAITPTQAVHTVRANSGTTDNLDTITLTNSSMVALAARSGDTITIRDSVDNIRTYSGEDLTLTGDQALMAWRIGSLVYVIGGGSPAPSLNVTYATIQTRTVLHDETLVAAGTFDVSSISQAYDELELTLLLRGDVSATNDATRLFFNNDTTEASYRTELLQGNGATPTSAGADTALIGTVPAGTAVSGDFSAMKVYIPEYAGGKQKTSIILNSARISTTDIRTQIIAHNWENTAAITRIQVRTDNHATDEFDVGSRLVIVGIGTQQIVTDVEIA